MSTITTTRILHAPATVSSGQRGAWVWPLPRLDGAAPCILASTAAPLGEEVEIGYPDRSWSPGLVPVFAAQDGIVAYAGTAADGAMLCVDHAGGWSTQYSELRHLLARPTDRFRRRRKERVQAGEVIGHARAALRIRFGLSRLADQGCVAVDPAAGMSAWSMLPWFAESARPAAHGAGG